MSKKRILITFDLKKTALIAEIIGGVAIIISLIFVGIQFKENTLATRSATANATNAMIVAWYSETGNSEQSSQLMWNYLKDPESIQKNSEKFQATMLIHGLHLAFQNSFYLENQGTLEHNMQESLTAAIRAVKDEPGWKEYWKNRESLFFLEFRSYVNNIISTDSEVNKGIYNNVRDTKDVAISEQNDKNKLDKFEHDKMIKFGEKYTEAWNSRQPAKMASFYAEDGVLTINKGTPSVGREQLAKTAQSFMQAFPDMVLTMDRLIKNNGTYRYHWTFKGTNNGPNGSGNKVEFSGFEEWTMNNDGLIQNSFGTFDAEDYERQLKGN